MSTRGILALFIVLAVLGWVGLASFTYYNPPGAWNRWIVVTILWLTLWATLLPLAYWFHLRRQRLGAEEGIVPRAARQSALAALFITLCLWLRMVRALNWANLILLLLLLVLTEVLLSKRRPGNEK
jgi:hypothetical protein